MHPDWDTCQVMRTRQREFRRHAKAERRSDEAALYYIIERDLARGALFPGNNGWFRQVPIKGGRPDYAIRYGDRLLCIEVKTDVPDKWDFAQIDDHYGRYFDGLYLAYPADRAGEAIFFSREKEWYETVGLISLTLFRSHVIRPAAFRKRDSNEIWGKWFDDEVWLKRINSSSSDLKRLGASALKDLCLYTSYNRNSEHSEEEISAITFRDSDWKTLALLYAAAEAIGYSAWFRYEWLETLSREKLGWGWPEFEKLSAARLATFYSFGPESLWMYALTDEACSMIGQLRKTIKANLAPRTWKRIIKLIDEIRAENNSIQRETRPTIMAE